MAVPAHVNAASARWKKTARDAGSFAVVVDVGGARRPRLRGSGDGFGDGRRAARDEKRDGSRGGARARHRLARLSKQREVSFHLLRAASGRMASMDGVLAVARPSVLIPTRRAATSVTTGWPTNAASTRRDARLTFPAKDTTRVQSASRHRETSLAVAPAHHEGDVLRGERRER